MKVARIRNCRTDDAGCRYLEWGWSGCQRNRDRGGRRSASLVCFLRQERQQITESTAFATVSMGIFFGLLYTCISACNACAATPAQRRQLRAFPISGEARVWKLKSSTPGQGSLSLCGASVPIDTPWWTSTGSQRHKL